VCFVIVLFGLLIFGMGRRYREREENERLERDLERQVAKLGEEIDRMELVVQAQRIINAKEQAWHDKLQKLLRGGEGVVLVERKE